MNKRDMALGLLAGLAGASLAGTASTAQAAMGEEDARAAIMTWLDALQTGDPSAVEAVLAPEFQILRSDGTGHDRTSYLTDMPKQTSKPGISQLAFSGNGDLIVTRYILQLEQTINNKPVQASAPRLSVFRRGGSGWLIVAHANFAHIG
jgi:ketosteroid isomerase-like protein